MKYRKMPSGYGMVLLSVMQNESITIESKAIYSLLCSYTGSNDCCFPKVETICKSLNISEKRFYKHMNLLIDHGLVIKDKLYKHDLRNNNKYIVMYPEDTKQQDDASQYVSSDISQNDCIEASQKVGVINSNIYNSNTMNNIYTEDAKTTIKPLFKNTIVHSDYLKYWNSKNIIVHSEKIVANHIKKTHIDLIKLYIDQYGENTIYKAIDNYNAVIKSDDYYFSYSWPFWDFIVRGLSKFVDEAKPLENYRTKKTEVSKKIDYNKFDEACQKAGY